MRSQSRPTRIVARTIAVLALFACTTARADDFSDFRIPRHDVLSWTGAMNANGSQTTQDDTPYRSLTGAVAGSAHSFFDLQRTDDIATTRLSMSLRFEGNQVGSHATSILAIPALGVSNVSDVRDSRRATRESWYVLVGQTRQFATAWYVDADASVHGDGARNWGNVSSRLAIANPGHLEEQFRESDSRTRQDRIFASGSLGAGYGRVRDATGIHMALVMEERLKQRGVLVRSLSHDARQRLADLFVVASSYGQVRDRPGRGLWAEIVRVLREDGALAPAGLDAPSAERARESQFPFDDLYRRIDGLPVAYTTRWIGWRIGPELRGTHSRLTGFGTEHQRVREYSDGTLFNFTDATDSRSDVETGDAAELGLSADWHRPFGPRWQVDAEAGAQRPLRSQEDGFQESAHGAVVWAITDRWYASGGVSQQRTLFKDARTGWIWADSWDCNLSGSIRYEIGDHLQLVGSVGDSQRRATWHAPPGGPQSRSYRHGRGFGLGLTYRFAGRFFSPNFPALSEGVISDPVL